MVCQTSVGAVCLQAAVGSDLDLDLDLNQSDIHLGSTVAEVAIKGNSDYTITYSLSPLSSSCTTNNPQLHHSTNPLSRSQSLIALSPLLMYNSRLDLACMDNAENSSSQADGRPDHYAYHQLYPVSEATAQCRP